MNLAITLDTTPHTLSIADADLAALFSTFGNAMLLPQANVILAGDPACLIDASGAVWWLEADGRLVLNTVRLPNHAAALATYGSDLFAKGKTDGKTYRVVAAANGVVTWTQITDYDSTKLVFPA